MPNDTTQKRAWLLLMAIGFAGCAGRVEVVGDSADEDTESECVQCDAPRHEIVPDEAESNDEIQAPAEPRPEEATEEAAPLSEAEACEALTSAYMDHALEISCPVTIYTCPNYLRVEQGEACLLYDAESVEQCITLWRATTTCAELATTVCTARAIEGSAPMGCP